MSTALLSPTGHRLHKQRSHHQHRYYHEYHGSASSSSRAGSERGSRDRHRGTPQGGMRRSSSSHALHMSHHITESSSEASSSSEKHRILLQRPDDGSGLGFTIRGGVEHGLGHFVSSVEPGSEAHLQGLRPGDQILRVDGMLLRGLTHREAVGLISNRWRVTLEVRTRGVIPIKDRKGDPVTWRQVETASQLCAAHAHGHPRTLETRVVINITGAQGLGCSICRGPASKPGIFVQSTKPGGLAREAGLRPGDQILDCNGISFQRLEFTEAVYQLKSSRHLDLLLSKGAGADLFPSESSGYDSSSSSSTGQCEHHRRLAELRHKKQAEIISLSKSASKERTSDVTGNRLKLEERLIEEERKKIEEEQERLKREAIKLEAEKKRFEEEKLKAAAAAAGKTSKGVPDRAGTALKSAIQGELARRAQISKTVSAPPAPPMPPPMPNSMMVAPVAMLPFLSNGGKLTKGKKKIVANLKNDKHDALMAEFKRAHKRMFNSSESSEQDEEEEDIEEEDEEDEEEDIVEEAEEEVKEEPIRASSPLIVIPVKEEPDTTLDTTIGSCSTCCSGSSCTDSDCSCLPASTTEEETASTVETAVKQLRKPDKSPPPPPERKTESLSTFKPTTVAGRRKQHLMGSSSANKPGIPKPDYDSTPERSPRNVQRRTQYRANGMRLSNSMSSLVVAQSPVLPKGSMGSSSGASVSSNNSSAPTLVKKLQPAFARRHPDVEVGSLDSFSVDNSQPSLPSKPPPFYFEPKPIVSIGAYGDSKSVRFTMGEEARLAAKDYRVLQAEGKDGLGSTMMKQKQQLTHGKIASGSPVGNKAMKPSRKPVAPQPQPPMSHKLKKTHDEVRV